MSKLKDGIVYIIPGWIFIFCCVTERELADKGNITWNTVFIVSLIVMCLVFGTLAGYAVHFLLSALEKRVLIRRNQKELVRPEVGTPAKAKIFLFSWLCILICWFPGYLAYYPAICAHDTPIQLEQIADHAYNAHHPIFHTLLIEGSIKLGEMLGSVNLGIGLYALMQMMLLSAAYATGITLLRTQGAGRIGSIAVLSYCCFFPFHLYMSISVTKDTIFSAFFLIQTLLLCIMMQMRRNSLKPDAWDYCYLAAGVGMMLLRNNGKYALSVLLFALLAAVLMTKKNRKLLLRVSVCTFMIFVTGNLLLNIIFMLSGAEQGDRREMLSIPIQQLARTYIYHGGAGILPEDDDSMAEEDKALINDFILDRAYLEYRPDIADPVKRHTNTYVVRYRTKEFISTYVRLFIEYPGDYLNAVLAVNAGYLYPEDKSHALIYVEGREKGLGYIQTRWAEGELNPQGIYKDSKWEWLHERLEEFADRNAYLRLPILKYLLVPGTYLWFWAVFAAWSISHKRYLQLIPVSLVSGYYLTLFLGPTVQLRYLYPVMIVLPFLAVLLGTAEAGRKEEWN